MSVPRARLAWRGSRGDRRGLSGRVVGPGGQLVETLAQALRQRRERRSICLDVESHDVVHIQA